jgi:AraC-like DNA-binding protein
MHDMFLTFEDRPADSLLVECIWTSRSERAGEFLSVVASHWEMVVTRLHGEALLTVRGPETRATPVDCPADGDWVGFRFKLGTFWPAFLPGSLRDRRDVTLPGASARSFWLNGSAWEYPTYENADTFVARLVRKGIIARDPIVEAVTDRGRHGFSVRSAQRRFARATGITHAAYRTIERARYATNLLREGVPIIEVVHRAGYFDQPHLTRSFKYLIGQTPSEVARATRQLSFLYKTSHAREFYPESEGGRLDALHDPDQVRRTRDRRAAAPGAVPGDR